MKKSIIIGICALGLLTSCNKDEKILNTLNDFNTSMEEKGYHFGDKISLPAEVLENAESISISFGDKETNTLAISPDFFSLGDNAVTFIIQKKDGESLYQDAIINVFSKTEEKNINFKIEKEYNKEKVFTQGFQIEGSTIYESDGQNGSSKIWKYSLGETTPIASTPQPDEVFSEGATIVGDKVYQLTWRNKIGFIYDKNSLKLLSQFDYPNIIGEGWGLTYNGKELILSDGSKNLYFLNPEKPSEVVRQISVAGNKEIYDNLNELEYHDGFIYANVWQKPFILKINPKTGEVVGKFNFTELAKKHTTGDDDVLNGIAFKDGKMLVTGKLWDKIYEVSF